MGGKPRVKPDLELDEVDEDGLLVIESMEVAGNGNSKCAGVISSFIGEAIEVKIHRKIHGRDITAMGIDSINFNRMGRGMAAMKPGAIKRLVITVKYKDNE